jgi:hypothetical protein
MVDDALPLAVNGLQDLVLDGALRMTCPQTTSSTPVAVAHNPPAFIDMDGDEGMSNRPSIFVYLVFGPGGIPSEESQGP